jgi:serine/threonine protein phosphatase PrpC
MTGTDRKGVTFAAASASHIGRVRSSNQDTVFSWVSDPSARPACGLLIVADGLGGEQAGDIASEKAVATVTESLLPTLEDAPGESLAQLTARLEELIREANRRIYNYARRELGPFANAGTTFTAALLRGPEVAIAHVGDSRAYLLAGSGLQQLTRDHTRAQELVELGMLTPQEVHKNPRRNVLTRSVGTESEIQVDTKQHSLGAGDRLLLCSDGLWDMVHDPDELAALARTGEPQGAVRALITAANERGGEDNIGVLVCEVRSA